MDSPEPNFSHVSYKLNYEKISLFLMLVDDTVWVRTAERFLIQLQSIPTNNSACI